MLPMKPQPPVTNKRTAPNSSGAAGVKRHTSHEGHNFGEAYLKNEIKRVINGQLDREQVPKIAF